jgi:hypothetical protein
VFSLFVGDLCRVFVVCMRLVPCFRCLYDTCAVFSLFV